MKNIYIAHRKYEGEKEIIVLADDACEAEQKAQKFFETIFVSVAKLIPTEDSQVYKTM